MAIYRNKFSYEGFYEYLVVNIVFNSLKEQLKFIERCNTWKIMPDDCVVVKCAPKTRKQREKRTVEAVSFHRFFIPMKSYLTA